MEEPAARESLSTLKIYVECLSRHPQWQVHPGDHLSKGFYEALKFTATAWDFAMQAIGEWCLLGVGELGCFLLDSFSRSQANFEGHLILLLKSAPHALTPNCVMQPATPPPPVQKALCGLCLCLGGLKPQIWRPDPSFLSEATVFE